MRLKPLHDWAVIVPSEAEEKTPGGLYIPDTAKQKPEEGVVEAIGPGALEEEKRGKKKDEKKERKFVPTEVKPGDRVLYERWAGQTYKVGGEDRILVRERNILGLIERPLQIPAATSSSSPTAIERSVPAPVMKTPVKTVSTPVKARSQETPKKGAAKPAKSKTGAKKTGKKK